jgi:hypothetical protein
MMIFVVALLVIEQGQLKLMRMMIEIVVVVVVVEMLFERHLM